ncbi:LysR family transcriptional regulator [Alginatibacterium sediminis]|uniref:LysR family transcriptional regulator n=1 Tax=Alginatibacterium sediminis TaxID=2164068 RepID=A0A420EDI1_9ALTE|nr:LysR family transcriptional regulator [Alginatibacterium sediminis]RKF18733.1 LysR family transcriptional regulator [Alginatibacterium sediminis]
MINNTNLADIRSFVLTAQLGNFTKAAEALGVSRSHVSRQISQLEADMGVTLLIRTTRTQRLSLAGARFFRECETALASIDQALLAALDNTEALRGLIRVNCVGGYIGEEIIVKFVSQYMRSQANIDISLDFSSHRVDLIEDDFDVAFRMGQIEDAGFVAKKLMDIEMVTLASPEYVQSHGEVRHPRELSQHRTLCGSVTKWTYINGGDPSQHAEVVVNGRLHSKNGRALVDGALQGNGIIRVPMMYCAQHVESGRLLRIMPEWEIPSVEFSVIYHRDKYQSKRLSSFISYIKEQFESLKL